MRRNYLYYVLLVLLAPACYEAGKPADVEKKKKAFLFKETIITGNDTGMYSLSGFRSRNWTDMLCHRWELDNNGYDNSDFNLHQLDIFKDSTALRNGLGPVRIGRWHIKMIGQQRLLELEYTNNTKEQFLIESVGAHELVVVYKGLSDIITRKLGSDGLVHRNMYSDPFHPVNNRWRLKPSKAESDSAIKDRVKQCIRFYALYYRDNIRRQKATIDFQGLPVIFEWYRRGIGLPDREDIHKSWVNCFYNREQALKGYDILHNLIVQYEFDWPENAPNWVYETYSVLEQMYHKL